MNSWLSRVPQGARRAGSEGTPAYGADSAFHADLMDASWFFRTQELLEAGEAAKHYLEDLEVRLK